MLIEPTWGIGARGAVGVNLKTAPGLVQSFPRCQNNATRPGAAPLWYYISDTRVSLTVSGVISEAEFKHSNP